MAFKPSVSESPTVVFFDGGCGLCRREIRLMRRLDTHDKVEWVDINADMKLLEAFGVKYEVAMSRFHVLDKSGVMRVGVPAFLSLWSQLPALKLLARVIYLTRSTWMLEPAYEKFAAWRLRNRLPAMCNPYLSGR